MLFYVLLYIQIVGQLMSPTETAFVVLARQEVKPQPCISVVELEQNYQNKISSLPTGDVQDTSNLPKWFRAFLRSKLKSLPESGRYQYPRGAAEFLKRLNHKGCVTLIDLDARVSELQKQVADLTADQEKRNQYPAAWEVPVKEGTILARVATELDREVSILPPHDGDDKSPLPVWFRVYLRKLYPDLPQDGPYQYPRTADRILHQLIENPNDPKLLDVLKR
jgi:hypothetical protein